MKSVSPAWLLLIISFSPVASVDGQVLFSTQVDRDTTSRGFQKLRVTIMGRPIKDTLKTAASLLEVSSRRSVFMDSLSIPDSLAVQWVDSLRIIEEQVAMIFKKKSNGGSLIPHPKNLDDRLRLVPSILPVKILSWSDYHISSFFGWRIHPVKGSWHNHSGIDLPRPSGDKVYATADGRVDRVINQPDGLGVALYVLHKSGYITVYGHLSKYIVQPGQVVKRGEWLGEVGTTGQTTGPHLHYSILKRIKAAPSSTLRGWEPINPLPYCFLYVQYLNQVIGTSRKQVKFK